MQLSPQIESGSHSAPRVGVRCGDRLLPALPVHLDGQRASLRLVDDLGTGLPGDLQMGLEADLGAPGGRTRLHLDWADGRVTHLTADMRAMDIPAQTAHLDICAVEGDWRPFMEYLALSAR